MSNYVGHARTNYVAVKDRDALQAALAPLSDLELGAAVSEVHG